MNDLLKKSATEQSRALKNKEISYLFSVEEGNFRC